ncbi:MAG: isochorismatase family protein [Planctomycetota bacterium]
MPRVISAVRLLGCVLALFYVAKIHGNPTGKLTLRPRSQVLAKDEGGHNYWKVETSTVQLPASETAIIICDMWDKHWSRGATERVAAMAPRMNEFLKTARAEGATIIHAPSDTMDFYADAPARKRVQAAPTAEPPKEIKRPDPPLPIDDSDGGSDTGEKPWHKAWSRQHPAIEIDQARDGITDNGKECYNFLVERGIKNVIILGVHTNMCVLGRSFAIRQMVKWGLSVYLVRDLTDTMYNPAKRPYVDHDEGTRLVVSYIEKFWCPSITSDDLLGPKNENP